MTQPSVRSPRLARRASIMRVINVPMRMVLGLPFSTPLSRQLMLLFITGRKTGKRYIQPVSYVPDGDTLLTPGGGKWTLNLREGQPVRLRLRGRDVSATPEIIGDAAEVERLLRTMVSANSSVASFVPVVGPGGQIDRDRVEAAVRYGFRIIRWRLIRS